MSSLTRIKDLINNQISDGRNRMPAVVNSGVETYPQNGIVLFYTNDQVDNEILALGRKTKIGLYSQGVQIAIMHERYDTCRDIAFQVLEFINVNMPTGITMTPQGAPSYAGINGQRGQHIYTIDYQMKGDK